MIVGAKKHHYSKDRFNVLDFGKRQDKEYYCLSCDEVEYSEWPLFIWMWYGCKRNKDNQKEKNKTYNFKQNVNFFKISKWEIL